MTHEIMYVTAFDLLSERLDHESEYLPQYKSDPKDGNSHLLSLQWEERRHLRETQDGQERDEHERVNDCTHFI